MPVKRTRLESIDVVRGVIMIVMALDHTRDFFGIPGQNPTDLANAAAPLFLTRWVTHFCAPVFFLLTGTGRLGILTASRLPGVGVRRRCDVSALPVVRAAQAAAERCLAQLSLRVSTPSLSFDMRLLTDLPFRSRAMFEGRAIERELDEELQFHVEQEIEKGVASGLSREAMRQSRLLFGGDQIKEDCRDARGIALVDTVVQDRPFVYAPFWQNPAQIDSRVCVRVAGDPAAMLPALTREVNRVDPDVPIAETITLPIQMAGWIRPLRISATFVAYAAALAVLLTAVGLYGTLKGDSLAQ